MKKFSAAAVAIFLCATFIYSAPLGIKRKSSGQGGGTVAVGADGVGIVATDTPTVSGVFIFRTNMSTDNVVVDNNPGTTNPGSMSVGSSGGTVGGRIKFLDSSTGATTGYDGASVVSNPGYYVDVKAGRRLFITNPGRVGINTINPSTVLHISSAAGTLGPILIISTGNSTLFEVNGTSVMSKVSLFDQNGNAYVTSVGASDNMGNQVMLFALNAGGFAIDNVSSFTATAQVKAGSFTVVGDPGMLIFTSTNGAAIDGISDGTNDIEIWRTSFTVNVDAVFKSSFTVPLTFPSFVQNSTAVVSFSTMPSFGRALYGANESSASWQVHEMFLPDLVAASTPILSFAMSVATGTDLGNHQWGIAVATIGAGGFDPRTLIYQSTAVFTTVGTGGAVQSVKSTGTVVLSGWNQYTRTGNLAISIKVFPLGGTSTTTRYFHSALFVWREQK